MKSVMVDIDEHFFPICATVQWKLEPCLDDLYKNLSMQ